MRRLLAVGALLLVLGSGARADQFTATQNTGDSNPNDTGSASNNGEILNVNGVNSVYAGSFYVTDNSTGQAFITFAQMQGSSASAAGQATFSTTLSTGGVGNQLVYLITQIVAPAEAGAGPTNAEAAAIQLAIWQLTTSGFTAGSVTTDQTVLGYVNDITTLLDDAYVTNTNSPFSQFRPYSSSTTYDSSSEFLIDPSAGDYQALIGVDPPISAPEPSTLMLAGLGALAFAGYGWRRRKRT